MGLSSGRSRSERVASVTVPTSQKTGPAPDVVANLDSVRGLACLLVVAYHVVGETPTTGMHLPAGSNWQYAMLSLEFLRMPLFTALSGYLYARERVKWQDFPRFWTRKLRRIGIPLISVTAITWILRRQAYGDTTPLAQALLFAYQHLWYLQALLVLFAAISIWDAVSRARDEALMLAALVIVMITQSVTSLPDFFSIGGATYVAPYFLFGIVLYNESRSFLTCKAATVALCIVLIVLATQQMGMQGLATKMTVMQLPAALAGMAFVVFLLRSFPSNRVLAAIGRYSYTIYLWQVIVGAGTRTVLLKIGIGNPFALFALICAAGVTGPILLHHAASRFWPVCVLLTGEKGLPRRRKDRTGTILRPAVAGMGSPASEAIA